jgi:hypothetical protein
VDQKRKLNLQFILDIRPEQKDFQLMLIQMKQSCSEQIQVGWLEQNDENIWMA